MVCGSSLLPSCGVRFKYYHLINMTYHLLYRSLRMYVFFDVVALMFFFFSELEAPRKGRDNKGYSDGSVAI